MEDRKQKLNLSKVYENIGRNIRRYRAEKYLTQEQLAESSGLSQHFISQLENGRKNTTIDTLQKISVVLNVEVEDLIVAKKTEKHIVNKTAKKDKCPKTAKMNVLLGRYNDKQKNIILEIMQMIEKFNL